MLINKGKRGATLKKKKFFAASLTYYDNDVVHFENIFMIQELLDKAGMHRYNFKKYFYT